MHFKLELLLKIRGEETYSILSRAAMVLSFSLDYVPQPMILFLHNGPLTQPEAESCTKTTYLSNCLHGNCQDKLLQPPFFLYLF